MASDRFKSFVVVNEGKRIVSGDNQVQINFESDDDLNHSWLELIQEGLATEDQQKSQRRKWDKVLDQLNK